MKKLIFLLLGALTILLLLVACSSEPPVKSASSAANTIHFNGNMYIPSSVSIKKGDRITFVNDADTGATSHILALGQNGQDEPANGAPDFGSTAGIRVDPGGSWSTPPWNTAGTYSVTCIVHAWMNLTVVVTAY